MAQNSKKYNYYMDTLKDNKLYYFSRRKLNTVSFLEEGVVGDAQIKRF